MKKKTLTERYIDASLEDGYYYVKYRNGVIGIDELQTIYSFDGKELKECGKEFLYSGVVEVLDKVPQYSLKENK